MNTHLKILFGMVAAVAGIAIIIAVLLAGKARAETYTITTLICDDTVSMEKHLLDKYKEKPVSFAIAGNGRMIRLFKSEHTWSLMSTAGNGISCILSTGEDWQTVIEGDPA